jgi:alcohol dehydrogenase class IV
MTVKGEDMDQFRCLLPAGVIFGAGQIETLAPKLAGKPVLLLSDKGVERAGILTRVKKICSVGAGSFYEFFDIPAEPSEDDVTRVVESLSVAKVDVIVAVGGGSVMDMAKLVAVMLNGGPGIGDLFEGNLPDTRSCSLVMVPTTAGTGSEATPNAIVFRPALNLKVGIVSDLLMPDWVILDPELLLNLPPALTASTGLDALCHALECYISKKANPLSDMLAVQANALIWKSLKRCFQNGSDLQARADMMLAAFYAGVCIACSGTNIVHALSYPLGGRYRIAHGVSNAILLAPAFRINKDCCLEKLAAIAHLTGKPTTGLSVDQKSDLLIDTLAELCEDLGIPQKLTDLGVPIEDLDSNVDAAFEVKRLLDNNPKPVTKDDIRAVYSSLI